MLDVGIVLNSDFAKPNTIGYRAYWIYKILKQKKINSTIFARGNYLSRENVCTVVPFGNIVSRGLNALRIFVCPDFNHRHYDNKIFLYFLNKYILDKSFALIHTFEDFTFNVTCPVILDMPMAHPIYVINKLQKQGIYLDNEIKTIPATLNDAIEQAQIIIAPSMFVKDSLLLAGCNEDKIRLVPFGVKIKRQIDQDYILRKFQKDDKLVFLFMGNVNFRKGITYLLRAWTRLNFKNAELWILGRVYKVLKNFLKKENLNLQSVRFWGFHPDTSKFLEKAHVYVFPSLLEGSSKSVYEAMSYGLPVITTYNAGSIVEDGRDGYIIPIADEDAICEKMLYFYENRDTIIKMGLNAFEKVKNYTWDVYGENVVSIYKEVLGSFKF